MKMQSDEIISEVWQARDEYVRKHGNNLQSICADLRRRQIRPFSRLVDRRHKRSDRVQAEL